MSRHKLYLGHFTHLTLFYIQLLYVIPYEKHDNWLLLISFPLMHTGAG